MYGAQMLRSGRTYDYEDSRATHRLHVAYEVLTTLDAEPTFTHGTRTWYDTATHRDRHQCALQGSGYRDCTITWPEWVTDELLNEAYNIADAFLTAQGAYNRRGMAAAR